MTPLVDGIPAFKRIREAIEAAQFSVWLTVAFFVADFRFPDSNHSLFDILDNAVARGLDVRAIFWRPNPESAGFGSTFAGSADDREMLRRRGSRFSIRWDRAPGTYCQHQKSWLLDAGHSSETAFVGGINLSALAMESPGHRDGGKRHDVYVELSGPAVTDMHHNFVQRWNEASDRQAIDGAWGNGGADELIFPRRISPPRGESIVQIQRMVPMGRYGDSHPTPAYRPHDIYNGERSILDQYCLSIAAARRSIYIENQAFPVPEIAELLAQALHRGVEVVLLIPTGAVNRIDDDETAYCQWLETLCRFSNFLCAGVAAPTRAGGRNHIHVHSKIMLVDDEWATIGSCNLHKWSLFGHTEMNAAIWDAKVVRALRRQLLLEHAAEDTETLEDRDALRLLHHIAADNRRQYDAGAAEWRGLIFDLASSVRRS